MTAATERTCTECRSPISVHGCGPFVCHAGAEMYAHLFEFISGTELLGDPVPTFTEPVSSKDGPELPGQSGSILDTAAFTALSANGQKLVTGEDGRADPWAATLALGSACLNADLDFPMFLALLDASPIASGSDGRRDRSGRKMPRAEKAWRWLEENYRPPLRDKASVVEKLARLSRRIEASWWQGRSGSSDRAVALTLVAMAHEIGVFDLDASVRDIAIRAGVGRSTVSRSLDRLTEAGLIELVVDEERSELYARRYRIDLHWRAWRSDFTGHITDSPLGEEQCVPLSQLTNHPVFLRGALGPTAGRLFFSLEDREVTAKQAASMVGVREESSRRNLDRLVKNGMAFRAPGRPAKYRINPEVAADDLNELAAQYGVLDWQERTADRYQRERDGYAEVQRQRKQRACVHRMDPSQVYAVSVRFVETPAVPVGYTFVVDPYDPAQVIASPVLSPADERRAREELSF